jgi:AcrR family transcriptional regulator
LARRNTKDLILTTSLALFNEHGEPNVTTNQIALEADISPGNLYYHYHSKDDIILELFKRFAVRFQPLIEVKPDVLFEAEDLWFQLLLSFEIKSEFRFFYRNLADLTERLPHLEKAMRGLMSLERASAMQSFEGLQKAGVIELDDKALRALGDNVLMTLTYWIPFAEFMEPGGIEAGSAQTHAIARLLLLVTPHMRQPERGQFEELAGQYLSGA